METQYLQQVRCLDPQTWVERRANVLLKGREILAIDPDPQQIPPDCVTVTAEQWLLAPGLVDLYSYTGEPGHEDRETLAQLLKTAIAGGFTQIALLPNTDPAVDHPTTLRWLQMQLEQVAQPRPRVHYWGSLTQGNQGKQLTELGELAEAGIVGFSDGQGVQDWRLLQRALEYGSSLGKPVALVPVNLSLRGNGVMREGTLAIQVGLPADPVMSESAAIAGILELIPHYDTPVHLMRLSTARGLELVSKAKAQGLNLTVSVNWHHLLLSNTAIANGVPPHTPSYDPNLRFDPPLGNEGDRLALIEGIKSGVIDAIAVDHQAFSYEEKTQTFAETPPGAIAYELILPCLWQQLVVTGQLTPTELWRALSVNALACLGLPHTPSGWILFDPDAAWTVNKDQIKTPAYNTPWWGHALKGQVLAVS
ncbi:MAG: dihydroorotase [Synechocystis sp.]|jgi:dihydroorotase